MTDCRQLSLSQSGGSVCVVCFLLQWWKEKKATGVTPMRLSYITLRININSILSVQLPTSHMLLFVCALFPPTGWMFLSEYKHYPSIFSLSIIKKYIAFFCSHHYHHHYQQHQFISFLLLYFFGSNCNPAHLQVTPEEYTPNIYWLFSATTTNQCQLRHQRR